MEIQSKIRFIRGLRIILDSDLAELYGVETKVLNQAVRRNLGRFPSDFMVQVTVTEAHSLRSQTVTLNDSQRGKHFKYLPFGFTEQGVAMLSSVLKSETAIRVNIQMMEGELPNQHSKIRPPRE
jgi:hypothetical protein